MIIISKIMKAEGTVMNVSFYKTDETKNLKFAVIPAKYKGKWVFCRHRERDTYECPGGHWEEGETIEETAKRELYEETGAISFKLYQVDVYGVTNEEETTYGMLFFAEIEELSTLPELEIAEIRLFDELPQHWTYPEIQPFLLARIEAFLKSRE